tara:strand:- start:43 stop:429 length:387 start_codon:yes stop_codon:yes gene_type:complete
MKTLLAFILVFTPTSALAEVTHYQRGGVNENKCYRIDYREEYVPGTSQRRGYVKSYRDKVEIPCRRTYRRYDDYNSSVDDNSCIEGSILGGIAGGGAGAALSRGDGRIWAIPLGIVGGALAGCQIDGG